MHTKPDNQSEKEHRNRFKGDLGETSEGQDGAHTILNGTELSVK